MKINLKQVSLFTVFVLLTLPLTGTYVYATGVTCGSTITKSTTLTSNLICSTSTGITIGKNGITLDCAGYSITQTATGTGVGIYFSGVKKVTLKNCIVDNWEYGFEIYGPGSGITLTGNTAKGNSNSGFWIDYISSSELTSNKASSNEYGFYITDSSSMVLKSNTATGNGYEGFGFDGGGSNTLTSNTASSNGGYGFDFYGWSGNKLKSNTANSNSFDGFYMESTSTGNTLTSNTANLNHYYGFEDASTGSGTAGTGNTYITNKASGDTLGPSSPPGLA